MPILPEDQEIFIEEQKEGHNKYSDLNQTSFDKLKLNKILEKSSNSISEEERE
jgi:hypothetical protein